MKKQDVERWKTISDHPQMTISKNQIESIILDAKQKQRKNHLRFAWGCCLIPLCIFTILVNTSQTFVSAINGVPILTELAQLFEQNPSIYLARNDEIFQKIDQTYENEDFKLYIESMVADESQLVIFYKTTIKNEAFKSNSNIMLSLKDLKCFHTEETVVENDLSYTVYDFTDMEPFQEEHLTFDAYLRNWEGVEDKKSKSMQIELENDLNKTYQGKEIVLNKELVIDDQEFEITKMIVYPLRTIVKTKENPKNTKKVLNYNYSLQLKNHQKIEGISNGVTVYLDDETTRSTVLESPYMMDQEFDLFLDSIQWVNKNEAELIYDIETQNINNLPSYMHYTVENNRLLFQIDGITHPDLYFDFYIINQEDKNFFLHPRAIQEKPEQLVTFEIVFQEENIKDGKVYIHNGVGEKRITNQLIPTTKQAQ